MQSQTLNTRKGVGAGSPNASANVLALARELNIASTLAANSLTTLTIATYGAIPAFNGLRTATAGTTQQLLATAGGAMVLNGTLAALQPSIQQTNAGLEQTRTNLDSATQGLTWLSDTLLRLEEDARYAQGTIDEVLLPAFGSIYTAVGDLVSAADVFGRAATTILSEVNGAVGQLSTLALGAGGIGPGGDGALGTAADIAGLISLFVEPEQMRGGAGAAGRLLLRPQVILPAALAALIFGPPLYFQHKRGREEKQQRARVAAAQTMAGGMSWEEAQTMLPEVGHEYLRIQTELDEWRARGEAETSRKITRRGQTYSAPMSQATQDRISQLSAELEVQQTLVEALQAQQWNAPAEGANLLGNRITPSPSGRWTQPAWAQPGPRSVDAFRAMENEGRILVDSFRSIANAGGNVDQKLIDLLNFQQRLSDFRAQQPHPSNLGSRAGVMSSNIDRLVEPFVRVEVVPVPSSIPGGISVKGINGETVLGSEGRALPLTPGVADSRLREVFGVFEQFSRMMGGAGPQFRDQMLQAATALEEQFGGMGGRLVKLVEGMVGTGGAASQPLTPEQKVQAFAGRVDTALSGAPVIGPAYAQLSNAFTSLASRVPGWSQAYDIAAQRVVASGSAFTGLLANLSPLGMVATLLEGVFQGLAPVIDALKEPLRMVGEIFGAALAPVLRIMFPIFKIVAIAATYLGEFLFRLAAVVLNVNGAILKGIGGFITAIGRFINRMLPGNPANGLVRLGEGFTAAGNGLQRVASGFTEGANELQDGRERLQELDFGETAQQTEAVNEQLSNIPSGFKIALARMAVTQVAPAAMPATAGLPGALATGGATQDNSVNVGAITINGTNKNARELWLEIREEMRRESLRQNGTTAGYAIA